MTNQILLALLLSSNYRGRANANPLSKTTVAKEPPLILKRKTVCDGCLCQGNGEQSIGSGKSNVWISIGSDNSRRFSKANRKAGGRWGREPPPRAESTGIKVNDQP